MNQIQSVWGTTWTGPSGFNGWCCWCPGDMGSKPSFHQDIWVHSLQQSVLWCFIYEKQWIKPISSTYIFPHLRLLTREPREKTKLWQTSMLSPLAMLVVVVAPRKKISKSYLREVFRPGRNISAAKAIQDDRSPSPHCRKLHEIIRIFSPLFFPRLQTTIWTKIVSNYKQHHPSTGIRYLRGFPLAKKSYGSRNIA